MSQLKNPILRIQPVQKDFKPPPGGGGGKKLFDGFTPEVRAALSDSLVVAGKQLEENFNLNSAVPGIIKLVLKEEAIAKSHRPVEILERAKIDIVGVGNFGELFLSVDKNKLNSFQQIVKSSPFVTHEKNLSAIDKFEAFTAEDKLPDGSVERIKTALKSSDIINVKLFDHGHPELNRAVYDGLKNLLVKLKVEGFETVYYGKSLMLHRVKTKDLNAVTEIAKYIGVQSIDAPSDLLLDKMKSSPLGQVTDDFLQPPESEYQYPTIGIIDSGIDPNEKNLAPWIIARHDYAGQYPTHDYEHGTFVAGMVVNSHDLNHQDPRFPQAPCKIVDVKLFRKGLKESHFKDAIEDVLPKHPEVKVWNISLGVDQPCHTIKFSDLGIFLDEMADKHNVIFVVAAGNYRNVPGRSWPSQQLNGNDRLGPPGDSVRSVTVGSIAHTHQANSLVKTEEPSPFSRIGPGPSFIPKPELIHYGGNTDARQGFMQTGVVSLDGKGNRAENVGTSFSAPIVSSLLANLAYLYPDASSNFLKAMLIHSAVLKMGDIQANDLNYYGFGVPGKISDIINCLDYEATSVFEMELVNGIMWDRIIPIPPSLIVDGKTRAEFTITLVYDPPLDANFGTEYCRTNVEVSLGTYNMGSDGKYKHTKQVPLNPEDSSQLYEVKQIEHGMKWSPVKVYRRCIANGLTADMWRMTVRVLHRSEFATTVPQKICVILTVSDPDKRAPIYQEWLTTIQQSAWISNPLQINNTIKLKVR